MPGMLRFVKELIKENHMTTITLEGKEYQLDIEQAEKLGLLKEKDSRAKSGEEFKKKHPNYFSHLTTHEAEALAAFSQLLKLRRDWVGEWEPDWTDGLDKYVIRIWKNRSCFEAERNTSAALSFPTQEMVLEFLKTFRDLIEEAKILI